jgi:hypothetical protein
MFGHTSTGSKTGDATLPRNSTSIRRKLFSPRGRIRVPETDVLQLGERQQRTSLEVLLGLRSDTKQEVNELTLPDDIDLGQPADLPLADYMHSLVTFDGALRRFRRAKSEAGCDALLDEPVVQFNDVV